MDAKGNVFVGDETGSGAILEIPVGGGAPFPVVGNVQVPQAVALDAAGNLYFANGSTPTGLFELQHASVNFGSVNVCPGGIGTAPCSQTATLNYSVRDQETLGTPKVLTEGAANLDFTLASGSTCTGSVTAGQSCTVNVTFAPKYPGLRQGAVEIVDGSGNILATTYVYGIGVGPEIAFDPGTQTTVGSGL